MATIPPEVSRSRLKLRIQAAPASTVVFCCGKLTSEVAADFKQEVRALIPQTKQLVLDLNEVGFMDSSGLGAIVGLYLTARNAGCELQVANLSKKVSELMGMTKLLSVFGSAGQCGARTI